MGSASRVMRDYVERVFATSAEKRGIFGGIAPRGLQYVFTATRPAIGKPSVHSCYKDQHRDLHLLLHELHRDGHRRPRYRGFAGEAWFERFRCTFVHVRTQTEDLKTIFKRNFFSKMSKSF